MGMTELALGIGLLIGAVALLIMTPFIMLHLSRQRGDDSQKPAVSDEQLEEQLQTVLKIYPVLPDETRQRVLQLTRDFLKRVTITSKGQRMPTAVMATTIAGNAALLCLHKKAREYPGLKKVIVLPPGTQPKETLQVARKKGRMYLDWQAVLEATDHSQGNPVIRQFAALQASVEERSNFYPEWAQDVAHAPAMLGAEQNKLEHAPKAWLFDERPSCRADLYQLLTDAFFQHPGELLQANRGLYELAREFFALNAAALIPAPTEERDDSGIPLPLKKTLLGILGKLKQA